MTKELKLTNEERRLIEAWRSLSDNMRELLVEFMEELAKSRTVSP